MIDRLLALVLTLTLAVGAIVEPPCCCKSPAGICRVEALESGAAPLSCDAPASGKPSCCSVKAEAPPCCQQKAAGADSGPCECKDCLTNLPKSPLNESASAPRAPALDDLPLALSAGPMDPPFAGSLNESDLARWESRTLDRPPPDRQALLCVWVI